MDVRLVALLGYKDHGKSTLIGSLLMQTGAATQARIKEAEHYSKRLHKAFEPAFILDSFAEERLNGMTIDTTRAEIKYKDLAFSLIDVPGHEELIKNMISGASYGEVALLLVSAKPGEGIKDQTKRHLFIAKMLGMDKLVVAVNKMDTVKYGKEAFEAIKKSLEDFVLKLGYEARNVQFVPISAYKGENLLKESTNMKWYSGKPLMEVLYENAKSEREDAKKELRIIMQGILEGEGGAYAVGKVVSGVARAGMNAIMLPSNEEVRIKKIIVNGKGVKSASIGESVALDIGRTKSEIRGSVISSINNKPEVTDTAMLRIFITGKFGRKIIARFNGVEIPCKSIRVLQSIDTTSGETTASKAIVPLEAIESEVKLAKKVPLEKYGITKELGRFAFYEGNELKGIGITI